jgi:hypothetical protein
VVAVKRVIPQRSKHTASVKSGSDQTKDFNLWFRDDVEAAADHPSSLFSPKNVEKKLMDGSAEGSHQERRIKNIGSQSRDTVGTGSDGMEKTRRQLKKDFKKEMRLLSRLRHPW